MSEEKRDRLESTLRVRGKAEDAYAAHLDFLAYPRFCPAVYADSRVLERGDDRGVGEVVELSIRGFLPYVIKMKLRVTSADPPRSFTTETIGDLRGITTTTLTQEGEDVRIDYGMEFITERPLLRAIMGALRPVAMANHEWSMKHQREALAVELQRRAAETPEELAQVPPAPTRKRLRDRLRPGRSTTRSPSHEPVVRRVLGARFDALAQPIRDFYGSRFGARAVGRAKVTHDERSPRWMKRGFPPPGEHDASIAVYPTAYGERWVRSIGPVTLDAEVREVDGLLVERIGPLDAAFRLEAEAGDLVFHPAWVAVKGLRLPRRLSPQSTIVVAADGENGWTVDVPIEAPGVGRFVHYRCHLSKP